jgi:hypothetical protein
MKTVTFDETKHRLVPIEPTESMTHCAAWVEGVQMVNGQLSWGSAEKIYAAMLRSAPDYNWGA